MWVKASERLPGWNKFVKWRKGEKERYCSAMALHYALPVSFGDWEWYDEGTAAGREEDAVAFVHFCESRYSYVGDGKWDGEGDEMWNTEQLYELFKQQKEK